MRREGDPMTFVHEDPEFSALLRVVAGRRGLPPGLIEKDYWVTHTLWALQAQGFGLWFKGGTSLSKGFGLIERFSEDLDLKLDSGTVRGIPEVTSWKSEGSRAVASRRAFFEAIEARLLVPGAEVHLDREQADRSHRTAMFQVRYPGAFLNDLHGLLRPFVLLEVGSARVTPFVERDLGSFVHEHLVETSVMAEFQDNRALNLRCVHPLVTLIEKLDAISRRFPRADLDAAAFVRHYEDAARIVRHLGELPPLLGTPSELAEEMLREGQLGNLATAANPAFNPGTSAAWDEIRRVHRDIQPMFWGARIPIDEACAELRAWLER